MGALARANSSKDDEARDVTLAAIGHSDRVDIYWTTLIARLTRAIEQTKTISLFEAEVLVIGLLAAHSTLHSTKATSNLTLRSIKDPRR
jgi:hypothetical protein